MKKALLLSVCAALTLFVHAQKLPFQGKLIESGTPVNGTRSFVFTIDTTWTESHSNVSVTDGLYFVVLGSINPLPANLFYTNDERQLAILVDGTDLGPVTLYKPLSTPLVGDQVIVKNDDGNIVGKMAVTKDLGAKNGEIKLFGTNGSENVSLGGFSHYQTPGNNFGTIWISDDTGNPRAHLMISPYRGVHGTGELSMAGETTGWFAGGFNTFNNVFNYPYLSLDLNNATASMKVVAADTLDFGEITLRSSNNDANTATPSSINIKQNEGERLRMGIATWGSRNFGYFNLFGPNSVNYYLGAKDWESPDLPYLVLSGTQGNGIITLEGMKDDENTPENEEKGQIRFNAINGKSSVFNSGYFAFNTPERRTVAIESANWGNGDFGRMELAGPNSSNFEFSNFGNPDRGYMALRGATGDNRVEIYANEYNGNEYGQIVTRNANGVQSVVTHEEFLLTKPDWTMLASLSNGSDYGQLTLRGPSTQNFYIGSENWGNHDVPYMSMNGKDDQPKMTVTTIEDGNGERSIITLTNNNGDETTYSNNGTWGSIPFNMYSGAMVSGTLNVSGVLTLNGDTLSSGSSDRRFKKEIQSLGNKVLSQISSLNGYSYFFRTDEFPQKHFSESQQIGLIAQELEEQFPALVKTGSDGYMSVNYNGFTAVLLEAVKELNAKVDKLESDNNLLQAQLSASVEKSDEMAELKKQVDLLTKLVQEKMTDSEKTAAEN